ncbi:MAG: hypothetical protein HZA93_17025 [Verrucomicrobia bacterium]|nr:hypothetical protein [Verrucomicrobiota bacterium]
MFESHPSASVRHATLADDGRPFLTFDDVTTLEAARRDPTGFGRGLRKLATAAGKRFAAGFVLYGHDTVVPFGDRFWAVPHRVAVGMTAFGRNPQRTVILLPGEEQIVVTKEVFVVRVADANDEGWDPFYMFWALCLRATRRQWQRVTLMQTNREDCGDRYLEVRIPVPKSKAWATEVSAAFRGYFTTIATAKVDFTEKVGASSFDFIASVLTGDRGESTGDTEEELPLDAAILEKND